MKSNSKLKNAQDDNGEQSILLDERTIYLEGVKLLQRQEKISHFLTLIISLVLITLLFVVLMIA